MQPYAKPANLGGVGRGAWYIYIYFFAQHFAQNLSGTGGPRSRQAAASIAFNFTSASD